MFNHDIKQNFDTVGKHSINFKFHGKIKNMKTDLNPRRTQGEAVK